MPKEKSDERAMKIAAAKFIPIENKSRCAQPKLNEMPFAPLSTCHQVYAKMCGEQQWLLFDSHYPSNLFLDVFPPDCVKWWEEKAHH